MKKTMRLLIENDYYYILEDKEALEKELDSFDQDQVKLGKKVEREHDNGNDVDVVRSEEDLIKIVLAHLREDPKYYTKLEKVEEGVQKSGRRKKKGLTSESRSGTISEAPHIAVGDKVVDLEFEKDKVAALKNIIRAIMKREITDKYGSSFRLSSDHEVDEFIKKIMSNPQVIRLIS